MGGEEGNTNNCVNGWGGDHLGLCMQSVREYRQHVLTYPHFILQYSTVSSRFLSQEFLWDRKSCLLQLGDGSMLALEIYGAIFPQVCKEVSTPGQGLRVTVIF